MERIVYKIGYLVMGMWMFVSCSDRVIDPDDSSSGSGDKMVPIALDITGLFEDLPSTYGTDYPNEGTAPSLGVEKQISDITVYIFNSGDNACEAILQSIGPGNEVGPVLVRTGYKDLVAVVNATGKMTLPVTPAGVTLPALLELLTDAQTALPVAPFLMTGRKSNVPVPNEVHLTNPYKISIDVERTCAKVTLEVTKSNQSVSHTIELLQVNMYQGANRVPLFNAPATNPTAYTLTGTTSTFDLSGMVPNKPNYCAVLDSFYTYESLCGSDKSKAVYFEIVTMVNNASTRKATFYLGEYSTTPGDTVFNVKRNYWYKVKVDIVKPGMDSIYITINAQRWNLADTQTEVPGGGYEVVGTALPLKLVKNYTVDDMTAEQRIAAIGQHSKGASWIDLKVSDGYPWKLEFTGADQNQALFSIDSGLSWLPNRIAAMGDDQTYRIYVYRPYVENAEPVYGPAFSLTVGGALAGGNVTGGTVVRDFVVQPRDTTPIPTNCYILRPRLGGTPANETHAYIPLKGVYRYWEDYLLANGKTIPDDPLTAEILWQERSGVLKAAPTVINANKRDSAYLFVESGFIQGNAVITMKVGSDVYWSFHIWVTEYNPYEVAGQKLYPGQTGVANNIFMDRNLGALSNRYDLQGDARGLYYQFGRKDPFPRGSDWNGGSSFLWSPSPGVTLSAGTSLTTSTNVRPLTAIPATLRNPTTFYNISNWPLSIESDYLWDTKAGNKSAFDPCPEGWRVPSQENIGSTDSPWENLDANNGTVYNFTNTLVGYTVGRYHPQIGYYPFSGYLSVSGTVTMLGTTTEAYYWTSWKGTAMAGTGLRITNNAPTTGVSVIPSINKYYGAPVRCVVDVNYLISAAGGGLFGSSAGSMEENIIP